MYNNVDRAMRQNRETHRQQEENNAHLNIQHPSQKSILRQEIFFIATRYQIQQYNRHSINGKCMHWTLGLRHQLQFQRIINFQCSKNLSLFKPIIPCLKKPKTQGADCIVLCNTIINDAANDRNDQNLEHTNTTCQGQKDWPSYHSSHEP